MNKILLTRSEEENELAARELSQLGFSPYFAPMLSYKNSPYDSSTILQHIIITSKHAAKVVASWHLQPESPEDLTGVGNGEGDKDKDREGKLIEAWVVGQESATILQTNPCIKITGVAKNLKNLTNIISMIPQEEAPEFFAKTVYLSGNIVTHDLPEYIKRDIIYEVSYVEEIPENTVAAIKNGEIRYIMAFSKNSAINLIRLFRLYKLLPYVHHSAVIGISPEVARLFDGICSKVLHSELPNFSDMIKILVHEQKNT